MMYSQQLKKQARRSNFANLPETHLCGLLWGGTFSPICCDLNQGQRGLHYSRAKMFFISKDGMYAAKRQEAGAAIDSNVNVTT
jgi:hypothetical protein